MKVLHIIDSGGLYGAEVMLLNLVAEQIKMGLNPTIASIGEKHISGKPFETEAIKRGFKVMKFRMRAGLNFLGVLEILRYVRLEGFDLTHSHGYKGNILFGFIPKTVRRTPLVATHHGWTSTKLLSKIRFYEWIDAQSHKFIDAIVFVNKAILSNSRFKKHRGDNLYVVNNGIPISEENLPAGGSSDSTFSEIDKRILGFSKRGYSIGAIGRLSKEKGYQYLIEAFNSLIQRGINANLAIIGEGPERDPLEELVKRYNLKDRVLLPGYKSNAKNYLSYFDVFVVPSLTEGMPITLLEAMQAKVPVIATSVGGVPDIIKNRDTGVLVPSANEKALEKAILLLIDNKKIGEQIIIKAQQVVKNKYSSLKMAHQYLDIYNKIVSEYAAE